MNQSPVAARKPELVQAGEAPDKLLQPSGHSDKPVQDRVNPEKVPLAELASREWVAGLIAGNLILALALWLPPAFGYPPGALVPGGTYAPWVFGPIQVLLRWMSPLLGGVFVPVAGLLLLLGLPFLARKWARRLVAFLFWSFYAAVIVLTVYFFTGSR